MISDNLKGFLGICRKAGKISPGHDAAVAAIKQGKAFLAVTCTDSSSRLKREIADECAFKNRKVKYADASFTMEELSLAIGTRASVITVDDRGLAAKLYSIITGGYEYDKKI